MDSPNYRAFLSYSHRDAKWADWLHRSLESYRPPRHLVGVITERGPVPRRLTPVFRDREELASATDLGTAISEALRRSACQIVICSPRSAQSRWVNEEILAFKRLGREDRVFCLIVDGEPNASDDPAQEHDECFPPALRHRLAADGSLSTLRAEPIAADARPGKDGRGNAKLKLIAGILGVGFDSLRRREQQRRQRQMLAITSAALAGMVLTSGLAAFALIARSTAQRQTSLAVREAETARQTTSFLVDLFRVSDPSEARGNSVTAREMLDKGASRISTQLTQQPQIQATLMDTLGTVYMGLGLYGEAKPLLETAVAKRRALRASDPAPLAASLGNLADLLTLRAEYAAAEHAYRQSIALHASLPADRRDEAALARDFCGLGTELADEGRLAEAEQNLREALGRQRRLFPQGSEDTARTLQVLGKVIDRRGDLNQAIRLMQDAVAMQRTLWGAQPYPDLADAINDLGMLLLDKGDYERSEQLFRESIAMKRRLLGDRHPEIATGLNNLANVLQNKGEFAAAESAYRQALAMQRELLGTAHPSVANTLNNLAFLLHDEGDVRGALQNERESLDIYRKLFPGDSPDVARITNKMGFWLIENHEYAEAGRSIEAALAMRRRLFGKSHPEVASSLTHLAILQVATGRYRDALDSARTAAGIWTTALSASNWKTAVAESAEGAALTGIGKYPEAEKLLLRSTSVLNRDIGALPEYRSLAQHYLEQLYGQWARVNPAMRHASAGSRLEAQATAAAAAQPPPRASN